MNKVLRNFVHIHPSLLLLYNFNPLDYYLMKRSILCQRIQFTFLALQKSLVSIASLLDYQKLC